MKFSKKEIMLVCYLVFKVAALVAQTMNPELKTTFENAVSKFVSVLNSDKEIIE